MAGKRVGYSALFWICLVFSAWSTDGQATGRQETPITCKISLAGPAPMPESEGLDPEALFPYEGMQAASIVCKGPGTPVKLEAHPSVFDAIVETKGVELTQSVGGQGFLSFKGVQGVTIVDSVFKNLIGGGLAPVVVSDSAAQFVNCTFTRNSLARSGGLYLTRSVVLINDCRFEHNNGLSYGAIAALDGTKLAVRNSVFYGNTGGTNNNVLGGFVSGAVFGFTGAVIKLIDSTFRANVALGSGGGAFFGAKRTIANVTGCTMEGNSGAAGVMGLFEFARTNIANSKFSNNSGIEGGAALTLRVSSECSVTNSEFSSNFGDSGAILSTETGVVKVDGSRFFLNRGFKYGGAVTVMGGSTVTIKNSDFARNVGTGGGAVYGDSAAAADIQKSTFEGNEGLLLGGALYLKDCANSKIGKCDFTNNFATLGGGAIAQTMCGSLDPPVDEKALVADCDVSQPPACKTFTVSDSKFLGNAANERGGDVFQRGCETVRITGNSFSPVAMESVEGRAVYQQACKESVFKGNTADFGGMEDARSVHQCPMQGQRKLLL